MSERYKILDAIMANPDPMIRQRLEMAYDAGRVSVLHEKKIFVDDQDFNCAVTFQTAFTNRDNATLTARIAGLEQENAKLLDEVTARRFTDERTDKLLDELEAENKRLREREVAVFAKGYRNGYFEGSGGTTAFPSEVHQAFKKWDMSGRKTHLDIEADIARKALANKAE